MIRVADPADAVRLGLRIVDELAFHRIASCVGITPPRPAISRTATGSAGPNVALPGIHHGEAR